MMKVTENDKICYPSDVARYLVDYCNAPEEWYEQNFVKRTA